MFRVLPPKGNSTSLMLLRQQEILRRPTSLGPQRVSQFNYGKVIRVSNDSRFRPNICSCRLTRDVRYQHVNYYQKGRFSRDVNKNLSSVSIFLTNVQLIGLRDLVAKVMHGRQLPVHTIRNHIDMRHRSFQLAVGLHAVDLRNPTFFSFLGFHFPNNSQGDRHGRTRRRGNVCFDRI